MVAAAGREAAQDAVPRGFKQTEIGLIPEDWEVVALSKIGRVIRGASPRPKGDPRFYGGLIPRLMVEDVTRDGKIVFPSVDSLTVAGAELSRPCLKGTLTVVCSGTVGIPSILGIDACIHDGFLALTSIGRRANTEYLFYVMQSRQADFDGSATHGGVFTNLTTEIFAGFLIPLPPRAEQEAIAGALSDADGAIRAVERALAKQRAVKQAALHALLRPTTRLPGFSGDWETKTLGDALKIRHGKSQHQVVDRNGTYPILATGGEIGRANAFLHDKPSVLIGRKGTIDKPQFVDEPFWTVDTLFYSEVLNPNNPKFLYYLATTVAWGNLNEASGVPSLNANTIEAVEIRIPPAPEQRAIAAVLSDMDAAIAALEARRDKLKAVKQGMMQTLLTGKVRLI